MNNHVEYFNVKTATIAIVVQQYLANNSVYVKTEEFREYPSIGHPKLTDWKTDTAFLCAELSKTELDGDDYFTSLYEMCKKHLLQFGRLIDIDLYNYIDELVLISKALYEMFGDHYPSEWGKSFWHDLQHSAFSKFGEHIYIHKFDALKTELIKLTDFQGL
ncbi:hypothetical protein ACPPVU_05125 [Mucilaginibacter sp. McL0603]|uniref:hypothetical protein n=1 Tax=Mucilaginibacter sp. McL0603 TaxID=3415670 RepID=UPI003CEDA9A1